MFNPFQQIVTFHVETSHLICTANQMTGFYVKFNTRLKWGKLKGKRKLTKKIFLDSLIFEKYDYS